MRSRGSRQGGGATADANHSATPAYLYVWQLHKAALIFRILNSDCGARDSGHFSVEVPPKPFAGCCRRLVDTAGKSANMAQILIVDDEPDVCTVMRRALEAAGHTVDIAHDGAVALGKCRAAAPDLMILDLFMPGCDGIETMIALNRAAIDVKLIVISGGGLRESSRFLTIAHMLGAANVLAKPIRLAALVDTVADLLAQRDAVGASPIAAEIEDPATAGNRRTATPDVRRRQGLL